MAGSRLDRVGTIFSRATGLLKSGAIKYDDRPLWYDIYRIFPPKYEPYIDRVEETKEIHQLLYQEDTYRALFFKKFGMNPGGIPRKLGDRNFEEPSQPFVNICLQMKKENSEWSDTQIFDAATEIYKPVSQFNTAINIQNALDLDEESAASKRHGRKPTTISAQSLLSLFQEAKEEQGKKENQGSISSNDQSDNNSFGEKSS